ncbi:hypothetical protein LCGC14_1424390 [marine sediment metagenome]|uniref:Uncharacterized protein n=1 Tax=marine sediment metagenome TaxID=412755 RepID=A0A0F9JQT5_9ZZZZ
MAYRYTLLLENGSIEQFAEGRQETVLARPLAEHLVTSQDFQKETAVANLFGHTAFVAYEIFKQLTEPDPVQPNYGVPQRPEPAPS